MIAQACEMSKWVEELAGKPNNLGLCLDPTRRSFDHTHMVA